MDVRVQGGEVQITLDLRDLEDVLEDLRHLTVILDQERETLEPRTWDFVNALAEKGITWG